MVAYSRCEIHHTRVHAGGRMSWLGSAPFARRCIASVEVQGYEARRLWPLGEDVAQHGRITLLGPEGPRR
jgi:hypothetical protein